MNNLSPIKPTILTDRNQVKTTSIAIAEHFGKRHDDVLRKIKTLDCSNEFNARNFAVVEYLDNKNEGRPMYEITRDGFTYLAMGFTGKRAAQWKEAYINAFNLAEEATKGRHQPDLLTPSPQKKINIPADDLLADPDGVPRKGCTLSLSPVYILAKEFRSPIGKLLNDLKLDGHTVDGAEIELRALYYCLQQSVNISGDLIAKAQQTEKDLSFAGYNITVR